VKKSIGTPEQEKLQNLLREIRQEAGITQIELAERLNTSQAIISNYERGEKMLDLLEICQVVDAVGIPLSRFIVRFEEVTGRI
jgi:transcriptional regulator with XRE-family HTH domain